MVYFVTSAAPILTADLDYDLTDADLGTDIDTPFYFI
jgi:hypothetical protein